MQRKMCTYFLSKLKRTWSCSRRYRKLGPLNVTRRYKKLSYYSHLSNKLKWVAFTEINRPKTKNYRTRSYKILQKPEFTYPLQLGR